MTNIHAVTYEVVEVEGLAQPYGFRGIACVHVQEDDLDRAIGAYELLLRRLPDRRIALLEGNKPLRRSWAPNVA